MFSSPFHEPKEWPGAPAKSTRAVMEVASRYDRLHGRSYIFTLCNPFENRSWNTCSACRNSRLPCYELVVLCNRCCYP